MAHKTNAIQVGIGGDVIDIATPSAASVKFQEALNLLPAMGGELYVFPPDPAGTKYQIDATLTVPRNNVLLRFAPGAILDFSSSSPPTTMFEITVANFRCVGARIQHTVGSLTASGRTIFHVRDNGAVGQSNDARFEACTFDLQQAVANIDGFSCIRATSDENIHDHRKGLFVSGCTFLLRPGTQQAAPWSTAGVPQGVCAIRAQKSGCCLIVGNHFRGSDMITPGDCGPMIYMLDSPESIISSNSFRQLRLAPTSWLLDVERSVLVRLARTTQEGHHSVISSNLFESIRGDYVVSLDDSFYNGFCGNDIGDVRDSAFAALRATGNPLVIVGSGFHDVDASGSTQPRSVIELDGAEDIVLAGNTMTESAPGAPLVLETATTNLHSTGAQVRMFKSS